MKTFKKHVIQTESIISLTQKLKAYQVRTTRRLLMEILWKLQKIHKKIKNKLQINRKVKRNFLCSLCNLLRTYIANGNNVKLIIKRKKLVTQCFYYLKEYFSLYLV